MSRVVAFIPGADFRLGHDGLKILAQKNGVNSSELSRGEFIVFMNNSRTGIKLLTSEQMLVYKKNNKEPISLNTISLIPQFFNGAEFNLKGTIRAAVLRSLGKPDKD